MNLAVCLLAYSMVVTVMGPPLLAAMTRDGAAPRLGVTVWLAAMASVLAAWVGAAGLFVAQLVDSWDHLGRVLTGCLAGLRLIALGDYGSALQAILLVLAALSVAAVAVAGARTALAVRGSQRSTNAHAQAARLAAVTTSPGPETEGALVLDSAQPAVYCLAGRPHTIVITRAALEALDDAQLGAVLAHEQAHLRGRHHHPLAITAALARVLPGVRLFTDGAADIARLLEMCADDAAARRYGRDVLVDALLALALPRSSSPAATPVAAMAAAGAGVAQRVQRLLFPPDATRARVDLALVLGAMLLGPTLSTGMTVIVPMLCAT